MFGNTQSILQMIAVAAIPLLFAITLHEAAHGWLANKLGDRTALMLGRVTLNPIKHIDLLGTIVFPIICLFVGGVIFGWAKPVPVTWQNLNNPRRDMALVALAGPFSNLLMAIFWAIVAKLSLYLLGSSPDQQSTAYMIGAFLYLAGSFGITINLLLMILNMLPIPPLDGSRVVSSLLPGRLAAKYDRIEPYGIFILLGLLFLGVLFHIIQPMLSFSTGLIKSVMGLPM